MRTTLQSFLFRHCETDSNTSLRDEVVATWQSSLRYLALACFFVFLPLSLSADGLELYSYRDDQGQLVVVDSLERIPQRFRHRAARNFIPSFKDNNSSSKINAEALKNVKLSKKEDSSNNSSNNTRNDFVPATSKGSSVELVDAPDEVEPPDPGLDEAAAILNSLSAVMQNNKQIYSLVLSTKIYSPAVKNIHTQNIALLAKIKNPKLINWKRVHQNKSQWSSNAALLIERYRTIQYTVSKWFSEAPGNLLSGFPAFIRASEGHLSQLNSSFEALKELDKELVKSSKKNKK